MLDGVNELKPCPFCGGKAEIARNKSVTSLGWYGRCTSCLSSGQRFLVRTETFHTEAEAIAAWNTRAERTCHNKTYGNYLHCSSCDELIYQGDRQFDYCPNCGAKVMKE